MKIIGHEMGGYLMVRCCSKCDWFHHPMNIVPEICPKCGEELTRKVGRYIIETQKSFMCTEQHIIGFVPKEKQWV